MRILHNPIDAQPDPELLFAELFGREPYAFWLDSASRTAGARFSFMGAPGPLGFTVSHDVGQAEPIFDFLEAELERLRPEIPDLPFDFACGFVGYLGYELKAECEGETVHEAPTPDAALIFADRLVAIDHAKGTVHLLALADAATQASAESWLTTTGALLRSCPGYSEDKCATNGEGPVALRLARPRDRYLEDIAACQRYLRAGDSYEICLTNKVSVATEAEPLALYGALRRANPAPYGAFLSLGEVSVLSSSPERFLRIEPGGAVEARPIKGTSRRGETPAEDARLAEALATDEKSRAENVTIVDLLRNDLGRVCEFGSVEATRLMEVETYETLHQLVSTVRGRLRPKVGAPACVHACFPPGSMTGAPKRRTMEVIDELEGEARGVYSGAIGWFGLGGGCELSVAIRTIVLGADGEASVGAGGAIVLDSDPAREYEEMLLKAVAPLRALDPDLAEDYRRIRFSDPIPRVTPRKSTVRRAAATRAG
jgi:para-aminobenzoate synthetase